MFAGYAGRIFDLFTWEAEVNGSPKCVPGQPGFLRETLWGGGRSAGKEKTKSKQTKEQANRIKVFYQLLNF